MVHTLLIPALCGDRQGNYHKCKASSVNTASSKLARAGYIVKTLSQKKREIRNKQVARIYSGNRVLW